MKGILHRVADSIVNEPSRFSADVAGDQYKNPFDLRPIQLTTLANQAQMTDNLRSSSESLNYFQLFSTRDSSKSLPPLSIDPDFRQKLDNSPPWPPVVSVERPLSATPRPVRGDILRYGYRADSCFQ
jgi:hypothetical protein